MSVSPYRPARLLRAFLAGLAGVAALGLLLPAGMRMPVEGASRNDWHPKSFWYEPWGASGVHKGIDIFAPHGRRVVAAVPGIVVYRGHLPRGGHVVAVLGPKWRIHYHAHLADAHAPSRLVRQGTMLGAVGASGNAAGKAPHLHYAVVSLLPLPWRYSSGTQGWKKMFFLDPGALLEDARPQAATVPPR